VQILSVINTDDWCMWYDNCDLWVF